MLDALDYYDAGLAKRLAEAADSFRDGSYRYFVSKAAFPYDLHYTAGFNSAAGASNAADELVSQLGSDYSKFGPYKTDNTDSEPDIDYDSIQVTFLQNSVAKHTEGLTGDIDAIILSISAYDKFFQPYYVRLYGIDKAADIRASAVTALTATPRQLVGHRASLSSGSGTGGTRIVAGSFQAG